MNCVATSIVLTIKVTTYFLSKVPFYKKIRDCKLIQASTTHQAHLLDEI